MYNNAKIDLIKQSIENFTFKTVKFILFNFLLILITFLNKIMKY